jgi:3-oxoacyl-[acyl-carrier protein] reductase
VKAPIDVLGLSNGARSGLTGFVAGLARQAARGVAQRDHQQPAARVFDTDRCAAWPTATAAKKTGQPIDESCGRARGAPAQRFGSATSSAPPVPSCAARTPATSPGRTC